MRSESRVSTLALQIALVVLLQFFTLDPSVADTRLLYERAKERTEVGGEKAEVEKSEREVWLGEKGVLISESEGESRLLVEGSDHLVLLRHGDRTFEELPLGSTIKDVIPEAFHPHLEKAMRGLGFEVTIEPTETKKAIGDWQCRRHSLAVEARGQTDDGEVWTTDTVEIDDALYRQMERAWAAVDPSKALAMALAEMEDLRVETRLSAERRQGGPVVSTVVSLERLVAIEEHPDDPSRFEIPEGYRQIPLDTTRWMKMARPGGS